MTNKLITQITDKQLAIQCSVDCNIFSSLLEITKTVLLSGSLCVSQGYYLPGNMFDKVSRQTWGLRLRQNNQPVKYGQDMQTGVHPAHHTQIWLQSVPRLTGQNYLIYNENSQDTRLELNSNLNKRAVTKMQDQSIGQNYVNSSWQRWK